jgi:hypothetical protein
VLATVTHWFLYSSIGIAVLSLAAIAAVAVLVWAAVMALTAGVASLLTRAVPRARDDVDGAPTGAADGSR